MSDDPRLKIDREELLAAAVGDELARARQQRVRIVADTPPVSMIRRLLLNSILYLPFAAVLAALSCWLLLEPKINDLTTVGGEVLLINAEPPDAPGFVAITLGDRVVYVDPLRVELTPGAGGEPALGSIDDISVGTRIEAVGIMEGGPLVAAAIRPTARGGFYAHDRVVWPLAVLFPLTATLIAFGLLFAEGVTTRNWWRMATRSLLGSVLAAVFATLAFVPAGLLMMIANAALDAEVTRHPEALLVTIRDVDGVTFLIMTACRSAAWACIGAAAGLGMNLSRSTRAQLRNSTIGGALGGALGGLAFDPIDRFAMSSLFAGAGASRLVGLLAVGLSIGFFVALVERLARDAWLRVRTGPLAGKSFILYKTPTIIGSAPSSDVYLFKDAEIDPQHAALHRVGTTYEIEDLSGRAGRRRLTSGDQIAIGNTILEFEERQQRTPQA